MIQGEKIIPVLFEEMDGVWLHMQDSNHKKMKKQELKVFTMYEGWDEEKEKEKRSTLVEKTMLAGMEPSQKFHEKREALKRACYHTKNGRKRFRPPKKESSIKTWECRNPRIVL